MSQAVIRGRSASVSLRTGLPWLVGAGVYAFLVLLGRKLLNDPDTYSHIAVGNWILAHGAVPRSDPFSSTLQGAHWIAFEWLSEIAYAGAYAVSGWSGVVVLAAAAIALAFGLLSHFLLRQLSPVPALLALGASFVLTAPHMLARPHALVLPVMVAWAGMLVRSMDEKSGPPYRALPLLLIWANLHGSVVLGLGLIGPAVLEALLRAERRAWPALIARWAGFSLLALLASCITPYGPGSLLVPLTTFGLGDALNTIQEWRPQDFGHVDAFEVLLLLGIFALSRGVTLPPVRVLVVLGLLHLALAQTRNADLLGMLAPLYLAAPVARVLLWRDESTVRVSSGWGMTFVAIAAVSLATLFATVRHLSPDARNTPQAAIAAADLARSGPVLNDYVFGGYLIFAGIAPFIDGRGELYGGRYIARHHRVLMLNDPPDLAKLLDDYGIRATLLSPGTPAVAWLDRMPDWQRVYADGVAVVHKRRAARAGN